jgi:membrane protease YdiL (CAAX protease family)
MLPPGLPLGLPYSAPLVRPARPRVWPVFVAFIIALVGGALAPAFVAVPIVAARYGIEAIRPDRASTFGQFFTDPWVFLPSIAATQVVLVGIALCGAGLSPVPWRQRLRLTRPHLAWYGYPVILAGTLALGFGSSKAIELLGVGDRGILKTFTDALGGLRGAGLVAAAVIIGLAPGLGEELFFRGYVQTRLTLRWGRRVAIFVASLLFAVMHMDWVQGAFVLLLGFYVGEISERTGSTWPCVLCHAVNNTVATLLAPLEKGGAATSSTAVSLAVVAGCTVVLALCVWYVLRQPLAPSAEPATPPPAGTFSAGARIV